MSRVVWLVAQLALVAACTAEPVPTEPSEPPFQVMLEPGTFLTIVDRTGTVAGVSNARVDFRRLALARANQLVIEEGHAPGVSLVGWLSRPCEKQQILIVEGGAQAITLNHYEGPLPPTCNDMGVSHGVEITFTQPPAAISGSSQDGVP